jgi:hypothetical protein
VVGLAGQSLGQASTGISMSDTRHSPTAQAQCERDHSLSVPHWSPGSFALLSVLMPGAGQFAQRRFGAAALQLATVGMYMATAVSTGGGRALWLALAWNAWSVIDGYGHSLDEQCHPSGRARQQSH